MTSKHDNQRGWVIVTALAVMSLILLIGLATLKFVDQQSLQSGSERVKESDFNLAEGLLYSQAATLRANWPDSAPCAGTPTSGCGYVSQCTSSVTGVTASLQCPDFSNLAGAGKIFNNQDVDGNLQLQSWTVQVRDDVGAKKNGVTQADPIYIQGAAGCTNLCTNGTYPSNLPSPYVASDEPCGDEVGGCTWDANGNHKLWVRVDAVLLNRATNQKYTRSLVALLQLEQIGIPFPNNAVVGGYVTVSNSGNKAVVQAGGSQIVTRCTPTPYDSTATAWSANSSASVKVNTGGSQWGPSAIAPGTPISVDTGTNYEVMTFQSYDATTNTVTFASKPTLSHALNTTLVRQPSSGSACEGWDPSKSQLQPAGAFQPNPTYPPAMSQGDFTAAVADADSTWNNSCPSSAADWTGKVVILQTPAGGCTMDPPGGGDINSLAKPGYVIVVNGTLTVKANAIFYGVIYMRNAQNSSGTVLDLSGNPTVIGGVSVDGPGGVILGSGSGTHASVEYNKLDQNVFDGVGAAGLVQNTWRELAKGQ